MHAFIPSIMIEVLMKANISDLIYYDSHLRIIELYCFKPDEISIFFALQQVNLRSVYVSYTALKNLYGRLT